MKFENSNLRVPRAVTQVDGLPPAKVKIRQSKHPSVKSKVRDHHTELCFLKISALYDRKTIILTLLNAKPRSVTGLAGGHPRSIFRRRKHNIL